MHKPALVALAAAALSLPTLAQTTTGGRLIGFSGSGIAFTPSVSRQQICQPISPFCPTGLPVANGHAGGAAYNAINGSVWLTQGTRMEERDVQTCQLLCSAAANLVLGPGSVASGLAICESRLQLLQLESIPGTAALSTRHIRSCPPQVISTCRFSLPTNRHVAGAVAIDDRNGVIYYATSVFGGVASPQNTILMARLADPCNILCRFAPLACPTGQPLGPLVAAASDECANVLYVSDGFTTIGMRRSSPGAICSFQSAVCCPIGISGAQWFGFDIEPQHPRTVGQSCVGGNCPSCNGQALVARGDPTVGNPFFGVSGVSLPGGTSYVLGLAPGRCNVPGLPFSCGRFLLGAGALFFPPVVVLPGPALCSGTVRTTLPIPKVHALCGVTLCAQGFLLCPSTTAPSVSVLNALELTISS